MEGEPGSSESAVEEISPKNDDSTLSSFFTTKERRSSSLLKIRFEYSDYLSLFILSIKNIILLSLAGGVRGKEVQL